MSVHLRDIVRAHGKVDPEEAAAVVWAVVGGVRGAAHLTKDQRENAFRLAGLTPAMRLNLAEALLRTRDGNSTHAGALSLLNRTYGLDAQLAAEAEAHHKAFFSVKNLRAADLIYRRHGGEGHFIQEVRSLVDAGGDDDQKILVLSVMAHSYARILGLDEDRFGVDYFKGKKGDFGFERDGAIGVNYMVGEWDKKFALIVGTIAHECQHALNEKEREDYAAGRIAEDHPRYLHAKASFINFHSYEQPGPTDANERRYEEGYLETAANLIARRFENTASTARVSEDDVVAEREMPPGRPAHRPRRPRAMPGVA